MQEDFVDYGNATEAYMDGLARIEIIGANMCWVSYRYQPNPDDPTKFRKVISHKTIMPLAAIPDAVRQISETFGNHAAQRTWGRYRKEKVARLAH